MFSLDTDKGEKLDKNLQSGKSDMNGDSTIVQLPECEDHTSEQHNVDNPGAIDNLSG